jgi:hypothetical protein
MYFAKIFNRRMPETARQVGFFWLWTLWLCGCSFAAVEAAETPPRPQLIGLNESTILTIVGKEQDDDFGVLIVPGFGEDPSRYRNILAELLSYGKRVGFLCARSRDGLGIRQRDLELALKLFRGAHRGPSIVIAHSLSAVWMLRHLQTSTTSQDLMKLLVLTNPVLQSPLSRVEAFRANSEPRQHQMVVSVRLGKKGGTERDLPVTEAAGNLRDLMRAFRQVRRNPLQSQVPILVFHDPRDPILKGQEDLGMRYLNDQVSSGSNILIVEQNFAAGADSHNLLRNTDFVQALLPGGSLSSFIGSGWLSNSTAHDCTHHLKSLMRILR